MYGIEEYYEPDDILRDIDTETDYVREEELEELSFDSGIKETERLSFMMEDVGMLEGY
jgi:hypothetical protein